MIQKNVTIWNRAISVALRPLHSADVPDKIKQVCSWKMLAGPTQLFMPACDGIAHTGIDVNGARNVM